MITSPLLPSFPAKPARGIEDGIPRCGAGARIFPWLSIFARWDDRLRTSLAMVS